MPNLYSLSLCTEPHLDSVGQAQFWSRVSSTTDSIHSEVLHQNHLRPFQLSHNSPSPSVWTHQKNFNSNLRYMTSEDLKSGFQGLCLTRCLSRSSFSHTRLISTKAVLFSPPSLPLSWALVMLRLAFWMKWWYSMYVACLLFFLICLCFSLICCFLVTQWVL